VTAGRTSRARAAAVEQRQPGRRVDHAGDQAEAPSVRRPGIRFEGVTKRFGAFEAVKPLDLDIAPGSFVALLGPSGCGKTTTLRMLAGLEAPTDGSIFIGDRDVTGLQPKDRDVAMVFQNYALYPHLSVRDNIAYPLKVRRVRKEAREQVIGRVAGALGLAEALDRRPKELSGGQRQRVALARAIVRQPAAFLMDEPLSNLDAKLRVQMRAELKHLQRELGITTIYVTHDQVEATTMADVVVVMNRGRLEQRATPQVLYEQPATTFVAGFIGSPPMNLLAVRGERDGLRLQSDGSLLPLAFDTLRRLQAPTDGRRLVLGVRPERVLASAQQGGVPATVFAVQPLDHELLVTFAVGDGDQLVGRYRAGDAFAMDERRSIGLDGDRLHLFDEESGLSLAGPPSPPHGEAERPPLLAAQPPR
jgi:ABC-type sugar transport system ATPase subunit